MRKRVAMVTHYLGRDGGGVASVVDDMARQISGEYDVQLFGLKDPQFEFRLPCDLKWGRYGFDSGLYSSLLAWKPDLIHLHGLFTFVSLSVLQAARVAHIPLIVSPHGMLDPWALNNSRLKKRIFFSLVEKKLLNAAAQIHVLNLAEKTALNRVIGAQEKVCIIPNGISVPEFKHERPDDPIFRLLYLGRLHPKKGVFELLHSFKILKQSRPDLLQALEVNIVGWGDDRYVEDMKILSKSLGLSDFVHFRGPAFGEKKKNFFSFADAFVLPSHSEGLPMSVLEAWSYGLPVLMTPECNLPSGFKDRAAIAIDTNPVLLAKSLADMLDAPIAHLRDIGKRGLNLVRHQFSWCSVTKQYLNMYDEVLRQNEA